MRTERLVRLIGSDELGIVDTYHDKIRETIIEQMAPVIKQQLHLTIGNTIESIESIDGEQILLQLNEPRADINIPARVFDLAFHFEEAKQSNKSLAYSILAAEQAKNQFALPIAIEHYQSAEKKLESVSNVIKYRVRFGFGTALQFAGEYEAANRKLDEAIEVASGQREIVTAKLGQADIIYKTGSLRASMSACESLLGEIGFPVPKTETGKYLAEMWSRLGVIPFRFGTDAARQLHFGR